MKQHNLWVEPVGNIITARMRGPCTAEMLMVCQERVLGLIKDTAYAKVLYDSLELEPPEIDLVLLQQKLETEKKAYVGTAPFRIAILVPNTRIAFLARIAFGQFGEERYRVFYSDIGQAVKWLEESRST